MVLTEFQFQKHLVSLGSFKIKVVVRFISQTVGYFVLNICVAFVPPHAAPSAFQKDPFLEDRRHITSLSSCHSHSQEEGEAIVEVMVCEKCA